MVWKYELKCMCLSDFFFFQAEDGIRDAQESRGLGDVYKRQAPALEPRPGNAGGPVGCDSRVVEELGPGHRDTGPVSYTHLTLPTIYSV